MPEKILFPPLKQYNTLTFRLCTHDHHRFRASNYWSVNFSWRLGFPMLFSHLEEFWSLKRDPSYRMRDTLFIFEEKSFYENGKTFFVWIRRWYREPRSWRRLLGLSEILLLSSLQITSIFLDSVSYKELKLVGKIFSLRVLIGRWYGWPSPWRWNFVEKRA